MNGVMLVGRDDGGTSVVVRTTTECGMLRIRCRRSLESARVSLSASMLKLERLWIPACGFEIRNRGCHDCGFVLRGSLVWKDFVASRLFQLAGRFS